MPIKNEAKSVLSTSKFLTNISCISMNLIREKKSVEFRSIHPNHTKACNWKETENQRKRKWLRNTTITCRVWLIVLVIDFSSKEESATLSLPEKSKNSIFEVPIILQPLNINNQITTSAMSISLDIIRKLIEYFLKQVLAKAVLTPTLFEISLFEGR